jgi:hypothetical protein
LWRSLYDNKIILHLTILIVASLILVCFPCSYSVWNSKYAASASTTDAIQRQGRSQTARAAGSG